MDGTKPGTEAVESGVGAMGQRGSDEPDRAVRVPIPVSDLRLVGEHRGCTEVGP